MEGPSRYKEGKIRGKFVQSVYSLVLWFGKNGNAIRVCDAHSSRTPLSVDVYRKEIPSLPFTSTNERLVSVPLLGEILPLCIFTVDGEDRLYGSLSYKAHLCERCGKYSFGSEPIWMTFLSLRRLMEPPQQMKIVEMRWTELERF